MKTNDLESVSTTRVVGVLAEFSGPDQLVAAAREAHARDLTVVDAYSPFPIHALDAALKIPASRLPWIVLVASVIGGVVALVGQWWTNAIDYPYIISGKPLFGLPAAVPITFEVVILCGGFAAFFGMLLLNKLPTFWNPLFTHERFARATNDGFFLLVDPQDHDVEWVRRQLDQLGAAATENFIEHSSDSRLPKFVAPSIVALAVLAVLPPLMVARARSTTSEKPPLMWFADMDFQPKRKSQTTSNVFADGRAMRPPVAGTVARGQLEEDDALFRGKSAQRSIPVSFNSEEEEAGETLEATSEWTDSIPIDVTDEAMRRGRIRYNTFCAACHGRAGDGDGPVSQRALELEQGTWVRPTSLHADHVRAQPVGQLFHSITHGVRKMPGYSDAMSAEDRWTVVLYLRALQRTRSARPEDLSLDALEKLRDLN